MKEGPAMLRTLQLKLPRVTQPMTCAEGESSATKTTTTRTTTKTTTNAIATDLSLSSRLKKGREGNAMERLFSRSAIVQSVGGKVRRASEGPVEWCQQDGDFLVTSSN